MQLTQLQIKRMRDQSRFNSLTIMLLFLAGFGQPLMAIIISEFYHEAAMIIPPIACVVGCCLINPHILMPLMSALSIYTGERLVLLYNGGTPLGPNLVETVFNGNFHMLGVVIAAVTAGYAAVLARRTLPLWRWKTKNNLRILSRRPLLFLIKYRWSIAVLLLGATLDTITTMAFMYLRGIHYELHPVMRIVAELFGVTLGVPLATMARISVVLFVASLWRRWCDGIILMCGILYCLAAGWNYYHTFGL